MFKRPVKDYLTFTGAERRGIIILLAFIFLAFSIRLIIPAVIKQSAHKNTAFEDEVKQWLDDMAVSNTLMIHADSNKQSATVHFVLSDFNPNTISSTEIKNLGVTNTVRKAWTNYRVKGGMFYRKEDLKKIYGLDSVTYQRLEPYIIIDAESDQHCDGTIPVTKDERLFELNIATPEEFEYLRGIGPVLAKRICRYRSLLGGFNSVAQLTEVYGITDSIVNANEKMLTVDKSMIKKINLNKADFRTLSGHPYITAYEAKAIIHYRDTKGSINSFNELIINNLIKDTVLTKLADYLVLNGL